MEDIKKFNYSSLEQLKKDIKDLKLDIPVSDDIEILKKPVNFGGKQAPNALVVHPMEGCDGTAEGKPDELTYRRYDRFTRGGAGLLWGEACAVVNEGRANPRQIYLCSENKEAFKKLHGGIISASEEEFGVGRRPYTVVQLTHSGRYSRPSDKPKPIIGTHNPYLDKFLSKDFRIIKDDELEKLEDKYVEAARLAAEIGFDAVDIKSCHRYLNSELLSGFTREGKFGGSFENRTRFLLDIVEKIKKELKDSIDVTLRMNAYDAIPYPYGFGVSSESINEPDLAEPVRLVKMLRDRGIKLINISCGNPYYNPHVGRPYDIGPYVPPENQLQSTAKMLNIIKVIQQSVPDVVVIATGFSWLHEFGANVAAGGIKDGWFKMAGFGRQAFAYPNFARDIIEKGAMERNKCCIACGKCTEIMRDGGKTGCVIRDSEVYGPIYRAGREGKPSLIGKQIATHI